MNQRWPLTLGFILTLGFFHAAVAQDSQPTATQRSNLSVTAAVAGERVRFTAPASVVQMRLEVYGANGEKLFDNELKGGNVLDWLLQDGQGERLPAGTYLCLLTVKSLSGKLTQRLGGVIVGTAGVRLQAVAGQMTAQQRQAVGPVEEEAALTILRDNEPRNGMVIGHTGAEGQIVRSSGALSFRLGDFFSGTDQEQMRLTAEGNLGIGIAHPQVRLDVDGLIRSTRGIVFPDGSVQYSAAAKTFGDKSALPGSFAQGAARGKAGQEHLEPQSATATQNFLAKFDSGGQPSLDSLIYDNGTGIGIGTTSPQSGFDYRNQGAALFTRDLPSNPGNAVSALQLGTANVGARNAGIGPSFLFFGENTAGAKSFLGRVSGVWENPTSGAEAGAIFFQVRSGSSDVNALTERMRITSAGNVGINTAAPQAKLHLNNTASALFPSNGLFIDQRLLGGTSSGSIPFQVRTTFNSGNQVVTNTVLVNEIGNVGIGTLSPAQSLHVARGGDYQLRLESPASGGGFWNIGQSDSGFNSGGGKLLFVPNSTNSSQAAVVFSNSGNVGIGTTSPTAAKLVVNDTNVGTGVAGFSSIGSGVFGQSTSATGWGVYGRNAAGGYAVYADGNAGQARDKGGFVKAMVYVDRDGTILRCYNGQTGESLGDGGTTHDGCSFHVNHPTNGSYGITLTFTITDRFLLATPSDIGCLGCKTGLYVGVPASQSPPTFTVFTYNAQDASPTDAPFTVIIF